MLPSSGDALNLSLKLRHHLDGLSAGLETLLEEKLLLERRLQEHLGSDSKPVDGDLAVAPTWLDAIKPLQGFGDVDCDAVPDEFSTPKVMPSGTIVVREWSDSAQVPVQSVSGDVGLAKGATTAATPAVATVPAQNAAVVPHTYKSEDIMSELISMMGDNDSNRITSRLTQVNSSVLNLITHLPDDIRSPSREGCMRFVESDIFEVTFAILIVANMALFGMEVQHEAECRCNDRLPFYKAADLTFNCLFVTELLIRLVAYKWKFFRVRNWEWNVLDTSIVTLSMVEVISYFMEFDGKEINLGHARLMKAVRTMRIFRMLKLARHLRPLRILVHSVLKTVRSLVWTGILVSTIMYLFAILFTDAATHELITAADRSDLDRETDVKLKNLEAYFGTVPQAMFVLFKAVTGGMDWEVAADSLKHAGSFWLGMFVFYISFTIFALLNVVTGIFCQSALESAAHDDDLVRQAMLDDRTRYTKRLKNLVLEVDADHSGTITLEELEQGLRKESVQQWFHALDIPVEDGWTLFQLLAQGEGKEVSVDEFVLGCLRLKGQAAKSFHLLVLMNENRQVQHRLLETLLGVKTLLMKQSKQASQMTMERKLARVGSPLSPLT